MSVIDPPFDKKFKTIVTCNATINYLEIIDWVNKNSAASVDVRFNYNYGTQTDGINIMWVGFEDEADALIFKIKYS